MNPEDKTKEELVNELNNLRQKYNSILEQLDTECILCKLNGIKKGQLNISLFEAITNQSSEGITITDMEGNYIFVNSSFSKMTGYTESELLKMTAFDLKAKSQSHIVFFKNKEKMEGVPIEVKLVRKDRSEFYTEIIGKIIKISNQDFVLGTVRDITERKEMELELKESEEKYRLLSENITDGVILFEENKVKYISEGYANMLGYAKHEIENISFEQIFSFIHEDDVNHIKNSIETAHRTKTNKFQYNFRVKTKNGEYIWVEDNVDAEYDRFGNRIRSIIHSRNITERKQAEQELKKALKEFENLNNTKDKFFKILAHDLRNPFIGISGLTEIMERIFLDEKKEAWNQLLEFTQMIKSSSKSSFNLLENLLHWVRTQTGEINVKQQTISMKYLLSNIMPIIQGNAFKKRISIEGDVAENDIVYADTDMTDTILRNLLTNAIKFTRENGKVIVFTKKIKDFLEISITDTGVGIEPKNLEKLFRIDSKFSNRGTNDERGTGLGLILCKEFVEKQGGRIWVTSEPEIGSTFTFTLPLATYK